MGSTPIISRDPRIELNTTRLLLRGAVPEDASILHQAFSDPEVMRYWSEPPHKSVDRTKQWINNMIEGSKNGSTDFVICLKLDNTPIGKIGVWEGDEIGFLLNRSFWGQGIAEEALRGILRYLFDQGGFGRITADTDPRNKKSIGLLKKLGFEEYDFRERTLQVGDEWVDSLYLKLEKARWAAR